MLKQFNKPSDNLWSTLEMQCVTFGFKYSDYIDMHNKATNLGEPLSEKGYELINQIFDNHYDEYCAKNPMKDEEVGDFL